MPSNYPVADLIIRVQNAIHKDVSKILEKSVGKSGIFLMHACNCQILTIFCIDDMYSKVSRLAHHPRTIVLMLIVECKGPNQYQTKSYIISYLQ